MECRSGLLDGVHSGTILLRLNCRLSIGGLGMLCAYSGDGDRRFRFIVTGLSRGKVLSVDDNSVGHVGRFVGTGFGLFGGPTQGLTLECQAMSVME